MSSELSTTPKIDIPSFVMTTAGPNVIIKFDITDFTAGECEAAQSAVKHHSLCSRVKSSWIERDHLSKRTLLCVRLRLTGTQKLNYCERVNNCRPVIEAAMVKAIKDVRTPKKHRRPGRTSVVRRQFFDRTHTVNAS